MQRKVPENSASCSTLKSKFSSFYVDTATNTASDLVPRCYTLLLNNRSASERVVWGASKGKRNNTPKSFHGIIHVIWIQTMTLLFQTFVSLSSRFRFLLLQEYNKPYQVLKLFHISYVQLCGKMRELKLRAMNLSWENKLEYFDSEPHEAFARLIPSETHINPPGPAPCFGVIQQA